MENVKTSQSFTDSSVAENRRDGTCTIDVGATASFLAAAGGSDPAGTNVAFIIGSLMCNVGDGALSAPQRFG